MDWLDLGIAVLSVAVVPMLWVLAFLRRRRSRAMMRHDTTPPTSIMTTGQRR